MESAPEARRQRRDRSNEELVRSRRAGRRLALASVFEAEFGQRTADAILERHLALEGDPEAAVTARALVAGVLEGTDAAAKLTTRDLMELLS